MLLIKFPYFFLKLIAIFFLSVLAGCKSMLLPDFAKEEFEQQLLLEKKYPEAFKLINFEDFKIGAYVAGQHRKPKIIFVHGSPGNWSAYERQAQDSTFLSRSLIIAVDRLGYGASHQGHVERSLDKQAAAILKWMDYDDPTQPVILVGHSYGGPVVARMAMFQDPRIKSVIILAGAVDPELEFTHWYQYPADWPPMSWLLPDDIVVANREIRALKSELEKIMPDWPKIAARVTVIHGSKDDLVAPANSVFLREHLKHVNPKIFDVPDLDHIIPAHGQDLLRQVIETELSKLQNP
jgi:pimeloyl-ACP methyl ester carboxylesterase